MAEISQIKVKNTTYDVEDSYVRTNKFDKAGGTITGNLTINGSTSGIKINDLTQTQTVIFNAGGAGGDGPQKYKFDHIGGGETVINDNVYGSSTGIFATDNVDGGSVALISLQSYQASAVMDGSVIIDGISVATYSLSPYESYEYQLTINSDTIVDISTWDIIITTNATITAPIMSIRTGSIPNSYAYYIANGCGVGANGVATAHTFGVGNFNRNSYTSTVTGSIYNTSDAKVRDYSFAVASRTYGEIDLTQYLEDNYKITITGN